MAEVKKSAPGGAGSSGARVEGGGSGRHPAEGGGSSGPAAEGGGSGRPPAEGGGSPKRDGAGGWTRFVTVRPRLTLLVALVLTALAVLAGGGVADRMGSGGWEDPAAESTYATEALGHRFPGSQPNLLLLVDAGAAGVDAPAVTAEARRLAERLDGRTPDQDPHIAAWRAAYTAFGAKPSRTRNSAEALARRALADGGLPRINRLVDAYNAVSVAHLVPVGGEDLGRIRGAMRLVRATGGEPFVTVAGGAETVEHPEAGEIVWCDEEGVTCRRWNWRQG
ncbi:B3/B4 domain-containing protein, partial [Streptomyces massasporeus]